MEATLKQIKIMISTQPQTTQFYTWKNYRCAYEIRQPDRTPGDRQIPLLLIHPIGVGLSRQFWQRFCLNWHQEGHQNSLYNPDLLGCGESEMPRVACYPEDWADQMQYFIENIVRQPVIIVVQGALFPVAIYCTQKCPELIKGLVLAGPPAWTLMKTPASLQQQKIIWNLLASPLGWGFFRYARRRQFLQSFSIRQLFDRPEDVDAEWLETLQMGAETMASRHAVFSFLAGFWREDFQEAIAAISQPTLAIFGDNASSISRPGKTETPDRRLESYLQHFPNIQGCKIVGRNVLPYESPQEFVRVVSEFVKTF